MDTDNLSAETYRAIFVHSDKFNHDMTMEFGVLAGSCANEEEYLDQALELIKEWREDIQESIDYIFADVIPNEDEFEKVLTELEANITKVKKIPAAKRTPRW